VSTFFVFVLYGGVGAPDCQGVGRPAQDREDGLSLLCHLPMFCFSRHPREPGSTFFFFSLSAGAPVCRGVAGPAQAREDGVSLPYHRILVCVRVTYLLLSDTLRGLCRRFLFLFYMVV